MRAGSGRKLAVVGSSALLRCDADIGPFQIPLSLCRNAEMRAEIKGNNNTQPKTARELEQA